MATPTLSPTSVTIPPGGTADVNVSWQLDPGTPDQDDTLDLVTSDGTVLVTLPYIKKGAPAEVEPTLVLSAPQPGQVLVRCDVATATLVDQHTIRLS